MRTGAKSATVAALLTVFATGGGAQQPVKCGWGRYQGQALERSALASAQRPERDTAYVTPGGTFAVHYDTSGPHSPDLSSTQVEGTPDWVIDVAAALDSVRALLLDLSYLPALPDGDGIYDVYLQEYGGTFYSETFLETPADGGKWVTYMVMDNDFADENYFTHGIDAARVTVAHEYFHAVHLAYAWRAGEVFFYELSATWFEEVAFPDVNDWVFWYPRFGEDPAAGLADTDGYSVAIFGHYLTQTYQPAIMRLTWERFMSMGALAALEAEVASYGSSLTVVWIDFVARLFLNGRDASHYFHPDQELLDPPDAGAAQPLVGASSLSLTFANLTPAAAGIQALALFGPANLQVRIVSAPATHVARMVVGRVGDNFSLQRLTGETWYEADLNSLSTVVLVVGGESGSIEIEATVVDTLRGLTFALDILGPNPLVPSRPTHTGLTLRYTVGQALPIGEHRVTIYNLLGQRLLLGDNLYQWQKTMPVGEGSHELFLDLPLLRQWPSGVYILRFSLDRQHVFTRTFTILR